MPKTILIQDIIPPEKRKKRLSFKKLFVSLLFITTLLVGISIFYFLNDQKETLAAPDSSWLPGGWNYRKSHVINSATGAGTNYQVKIVVHKSTGTDTGEDVYLGTSVRDDFGDVRFTDNDEESLLDYWMETYTSGVSATFWVEVQDDLSLSNQTIYVYYDKSDATTTSNGEKTFIRWDDFDDGYSEDDLPKASRGWTANQGGGSDYVKIKQDPADASNLVLEIYNQTSGSPYPSILNDGWAVQPVAIHARMRSDTPNGGNTQTSIKEGGTTILSSTWGGSAQSAKIKYYNGSTYLHYSPELSVGDDTWYTLEWRVKSTNYHHMMKNGTDYTGGVRNNCTNGVDYWVQGLNQGFQVTRWWIDSFFIRKFVMESSMHNSWGSEEKANGLPCLIGSECGSGHCLSEICSPIPGGLPRLPPMGGIVKRPVIEEPVIEEIEEPVIEESVIKELEEPISETNLKELLNEIIDTLNELIELHNQLIGILKDQV